MWIPVVIIVINRTTQTAWRCGVNKDIRDLWSPVHDLVVILSGKKTVTSHYDGYPSGQFGSSATGPDGPNTGIRWHNFRDGDNNVIDTGQTLHIGWSAADYSSATKDMYFTDAPSRHIASSVLYNLKSSQCTQADLVKVIFGGVIISSPLTSYWLCATMGRNEGITGKGVPRTHS